MIETVKIPKVVLITIQKRLSKFIIKSDSHVPIQDITRDIKAFFKIFNIIEDILVRAKAVRNLKFTYCNRSTNSSYNKC